MILVSAGTEPSAPVPLLAAEDDDHDDEDEDCDDRQEHGDPSAPVSLVDCASDLTEDQVIAILWEGKKYVVMTNVLETKGEKHVARCIVIEDLSQIKKILETATLYRKPLLMKMM